MQILNMVCSHLKRSMSGTGEPCNAKAAWLYNVPSRVHCSELEIFAVLFLLSPLYLPANMDNQAQVLTA